MTDWITPLDAALKLMAEADAYAKALGHEMLLWQGAPFGVDLAKQRSFVNSCRWCREQAIVRPRSWHGAPMTGQCVTFPCKGERPKPKLRHLD